jgi:hypothetical protein
MASSSLRSLEVADELAGGGDADPAAQRAAALVAGDARELVLPDDTLLLVIGEGCHDLWRAEIGEEPEKLGRTDAWRSTAMARQHRRAFAPVRTPLQATWTYEWGEHVPHVPREWLTLTRVVRAQA